MDNAEKVEQEQEQEQETIEQVKETAEQIIGKVRNQALIRGSQMVCSVVVQIVNKHLHKTGKNSLRDYERCIAEIIKFVSVPLNKNNKEQLANDLTEQNDSKESAE